MDGMDQRLVERLRRLVDEQHSAALQALASLEAYIAGREQPASLTDAISKILGDLKASANRPESIRPLVLGALGNTPKSVSQIAAETELSERQVRGVLYAGDL